jgi:hypothetical protein
VRSNRDVQVHVGPGRARGIRAYLPKNQDVLVIGQANDRDGNLWWQIQMPRIHVLRRAIRPGNTFNIIAAGCPHRINRQLIHLRKLELGLHVRGCVGCRRRHQDNPSCATNRVSNRQFPNDANF